VAVAALALLAVRTAAGEASPAAPSLEDALLAGTSGVNEGALTFLAEPPGKRVHHHHNEIRIGPESLADGWVRLDQCHENLDAVPRAEVIYRPEHIRAITVASVAAIDRAWVEGPSVQLEGVRPGARLCVSAESRVLQREEDGSFTVRNGPFMRRFLDGYYPMRVTLAVHYPCDRLRFAGASPAPQSGFSVRDADCRVDVEAWFEGRLNTALRFAPLTLSP
jgi:hypothetical protein